MKKKIVMCSIVCLALFVVGCEKTIELTDEENHLIAEYAAELLIKYDRNIDLKYYDDENVDITDTRQPTTEEASTEEPDEEGQNASDTDASWNTDSGNVDNTFDIAEIIGEKNISIKYVEYLIEDSYPSYGQDGMYIEIEAPEGYKLLVFKFDVTNVSGEEQYVDLYSYDAQYSIIVNESKSAKQMLTILTDDLYTYQDTLGAGEKSETVLLFQVADSVAEDIDSLKLDVSCGEGQRILVIQ